MLPFGRMLNYGNINIPKEIKQMAGSINAVLLLMTDGTVYGRGRNNQFILGQNSTTNTVYDTSWVTVDTDVYYCTVGSNNSIMVKNDGSVIARGSNFTQSGGTAYPYNGQDITSSFGSLDLRNAKSIQLNGNTCMILMNDGNLYGLGANSSYQYGSTTLGFQTTPYLIDTSVTYLFRTMDWQTANHYVKNGKLYCTGDNGRGYYSTGLNIGTTVQQRTYVEVPLPAGYEVHEFISSGVRSSIIATEVSTGKFVMMYCGSNGISSSSGYYDRGIATESVINTFARPLITYMDNNISIPSFRSAYNNGSTNFVYGSDILYSCGWGGGGIGRPITGGSVTSVWTFGAANITVPASEILGYVTVQHTFNTVICTKNRLYFSGVPGYSDSWFKDVGTSSMGDKFYEIDLPK